MSEPAVRLKTYAEYLDVERQTGVKHEYVDGVVYAMTGGTITHALLTAAVSAELRTALRGRPCRVHSSDQRVRISQSGRAFYPDGAVTCGKLVTHPEDPDALADATVLVEVLSPSTARHDRTLKLAEYRTLPSVQAVLFVHPDQHVIHRWGFTSSGEWGMTVHGPGTRVPLPHDRWLPVDDVYEGIELSPHGRTQGTA